METQTATHPAVAATVRGCLALADISGYSAYLAGSELDHAQDVLADLTETVVRALTPTMRLSELEGDAVFVYVVGERIDPSMLLDTLEGCYFAFRRRLDAIDRATRCDCNACILIPRLDLKFVAHHGAFARSPIAGKERLAGSDVILAHRLLKNHVAEAIGHGGYALFTAALVTAMGLSPDALRLRPHTEAYEVVGEVHGWVQDLHERWREEQERRRVWIGPETAAQSLSYDLPAAPPVVWSYLTDPVLRVAWQPETLRVDQSNPGGRRGAGTTNHCVHGQGVILEEIVDWRPFDYFTLDTKVPMPVIRSLRVTYQLEATPTGTRVTERVAWPPRRLERLVLRALSPTYRKMNRQVYAALARALTARDDAAVEAPSP